MQSGPALDEIQPPFPPVTFRVGVSGHRPTRLANVDPSLLRARIDAVLEAVRGVIAECAERVPHGSAPRCRVISSLAEDADRLVAQAGLDHGFTLQAALPFRRADYESNFESERSVAKFLSLLASAETIFELPPSDPRAAGYRAAGDVVLRRCDLLLVIWDGEPSAAIGGTPEMMERAHQVGLPGVRIRAAPPHAISFGYEAGSIKAMAATIHSLLLPDVSIQAARDTYRSELWPRRYAVSSYLFRRLPGDRQWKLCSARKLCECGIGDQ